MVGRGNSDLEHLASSLAVGRRDDGRVHVLPAPPLSRARGSRARHGGRVRRGRGGAGAWKPLSWKKRWVAKARQLRTRWIAAIVLVRTRRWIFSRRNSRLHARTSTTIASAERRIVEVKGGLAEDPTAKPWLEPKNRFEGILDEIGVDLK